MIKIALILLIVTTLFIVFNEFIKIKQEHKDIVVYSLIFITFIITLCAGFFN